MLTAIEAKQKTNNVKNEKEINERMENAKKRSESELKAIKDFPEVLKEIEKKIKWAISQGEHSCYVYSGHSEYTKYLYQLIYDELSELGYKVCKDTIKFSDDGNGNPIINIKW